MLKTNAQRVTVAALMLAIGILLPFLISHGVLALPGNVFLPMHIPVLLCGYFCGAMYGGLCGFILPYFNSFISGMPVLFPNAFIMSFELMTYGIMCAITFKAFKKGNKMLRIYASLIISMICGRCVYGIANALILFTFANAKALSVISATISGIPGILIQLILVPLVVRAVLPKSDAKKDAVKLIADGKATCVIVSDNKISHIKTTKGISFIVEACKNGELKDSFVADTIVGKASAMMMSLGGVKECYAETMSESAQNWLADKNIKFEYTNLVPAIINRAGDGICPMEQTVNDIDDEKEALKALEDKIAFLKGEQVNN